MRSPSPDTPAVHTLPNGVRVVLERVPYVRSAAIGIWIGTGSRDEQAGERGISHLIEHMLFKGTATRTARQIADTIESRGGHLNAFTTKEATCYEARVLSEHAGLALDVLTDMILNSQLAEDELEREKRVVVEEIKMYEDTPEEHVHDLFEQTLWPSHPLGRPISGSARSVTDIHRADITGYMAQRYRPDRIVVSAAGNINEQHLLRRVESTLGGLSGTAPRRVLRSPRSRADSRPVHRRDVEQVHFCIGSAGYSKTDPRRYSLSVLNNVLGGNMSSRLFQEIRERRGLAYAIGSFTRGYMDGGLFCVYGGTSPHTWQQVRDLVDKEFDKVSARGITRTELSKAKTQVRGALVLGLESMSARMSRHGDSLLTHGRVVPIDEILARYEAVTHDGIVESAARVLDRSRLTVTTIGPAGDALPA